jgi:hypothetical protein
MPRMRPASGFASMSPGVRSTARTERAATANCTAQSVAGQCTVCSMSVALAIAATEAEYHTTTRGATRSRCKTMGKAPTCEN